MISKVSRAWHTLAVVAAGIVLFSFLYKLRADYLTSNALGYVQMAGSDGIGFHPHHLLQSAAIFAARIALSPFGCSALCAGQVHSILWTVIGIISIYFLANRFLESSVFGAAGAAAYTLVTHGVWVYSTQPEAYLPVLGSLALLVVIVTGGGGTRMGWRRLVGGAFLLSLAALYHQASILILVPIGYWLQQAHGRRGVAEWLSLSASAGFLVVAAYVYVYILEHDTYSASSFVSWILYYTTVPAPTGQAQNILTLHGVEQYILSQINALLVLPEYFGSQRYLRLVFLPAIAVVVAWNVVAAVRDEETRPLRIFLLAWFSVFTLFFIWWEAWTYKFFILALTPLVLLGARLLRDLYDLPVPSVKSIARVLVPVIAGALIAVSGALNLSSVLYIHRTKGPYHARAAELSRVGPEECTFYLHNTSSHMRFYFDREVHNTKQLRYRYYDYALRGMPDSSLFSDATCIVMPLGHISRERFIYSLAGQSDLEESDWDAFLLWAFGYRDESAGQESHYYYELLPQEGRAPLLLIDSRRRMPSESRTTLIEGIGGLVDRYTEELGPSIIWFADGASQEDALRRHLLFGY